MPQIGRSDHFVAKSLLHLESKVDNIKSIKAKDDESV